MWWMIAAASALPDVDRPVKTGARAEGDVGLVVGIEDYFMLPDVPHASRDADAVERFLVYTRGLPAHRVRRLGKGANREQILAAVSDLAEQVGDDGVFWLYFAGHGAADPETGERVLLGADAQADMATFQARAVRLGELEAAMGGSAQGMLILDTCYSGRGRGGSDLVDGKRFAVPSYASSDSQGQVVTWTAAGPGQWSSPLDAASHGAFTYAVLGALRGWADGQRDGVRDGQVTTEEAQLYVTEALAELQVTDQRPTLEGRRDLVLSTAGEERPALGAVAASVSDTGESGSQAASVVDTGSPSPGVVRGDPAQPGRLWINAGYIIAVDGEVLNQLACAGCNHFLVEGLAAGDHHVEIRKLMGGVAASTTVNIPGGHEVRLQYRAKQFTVLGEHPIVQQAAPAAAAVVPGRPAPAPSGALGGLVQGMVKAADEVVQTTVATSRPTTPASSGRAVAPGGAYAELKAAVAAEAFGDEQVALIVAGARAQGLSMSQLGGLLAELDHSSDRKAAMAGVAGQIVDPGNVEVLMPSLTFTDEKELARQLWP